MIKRLRANFGCLTQLAPNVQSLQVEVGIVWILNFYFSHLMFNKQSNLFLVLLFPYYLTLSQKLSMSF